MALALWAALTGAQEASFAVDDVVVCPRAAGVLDLEFDPTGPRMAFVDLDRRLRVVAFDEAGRPTSRRCRGQVVAEGAVTAMPGVPLRNGPEWGLSQRGAEIYYTALDPSGGTSLARAWMDAGHWRSESLAQGERRGLAIASADAGDDQPRLLYAGLTAGEWPLVLWREAVRPESEALFPGSGNPETGGAPRWIAGERALSGVKRDANGWRQAVRWDIDRRAFDVLTSDPSHKDEAWIWSAPEFGGDRVLITVTDGCCLEVRREVGAVWQLIHRLDAASFSPWPRIFSPEPFVHQGRSYVAMQLSRTKLDISDIWITAIDPDQPLLRQVSDPSTAKVRGEPEWLALPSGVFVYYSTFDALQRTTIRRAATGL